MYDQETKLYYLRSRYYNPVYSRFVNADCLTQKNLFAYCENNPITRQDQSGKSSTKKTNQELIIDIINDPQNELLLLINCYSYALCYTELVANRIPGGEKNFYENVLKVEENSLAPTMKVKASFYTSHNIAQLIANELKYVNQIFVNELNIYYPLCCEDSAYAIIAIRANSQNVDKNGYAHLNDADFHVMLYADGFWSEKRGANHVISHKDDLSFSPANESAWSDLLQGVDTYYLIFPRNVIQLE